MRGYTNPCRRNRRLWGTMLLLFACSTTWLASLSASETDTKETFSVAKGRVTYRIYCINCHGEEARGDGSLATLLTTPPTDLTRLAQSNDGTYPTEKVRESIDGSRRVKGHGLEEMPVWGDVFQVSSVEASGSDETAEERANRKILELVAYLETMQEP
ncbi:MAG: cytochrome c [Acidobacteriota bacterium]